MRILQAGGTAAVESGGLSTACASLANHLARAGAEVTAVTVDAANGTGRMCALDPDVTHIACAPVFPRRLGYCQGLAARLASTQAAEIMHLHGLWRIHHAQLARYAAGSRLPLVVSPHGMVYGQALGQRARLKRLAGIAFQDGILRRAACLHATAQDEVDEIRRYGYRGPIALVPWGVDLPDPLAPRRRGGDRIVAYIGRFHRLKNLDALLRAWARVAPDRAGWRLVLAGYDEDGYRGVLEATARELGIADRIALRDPVDGEAREAFFASAELTVLPSAAENFAFVVPEALARAIPVVTTTGTPWSALAAEGCGWCVPPTIDALAEALSDATGRPIETLAAMGERGRRYVRATYDWTIVVRRLLAVYEWAVGRGSRPEDVQVAA